MISTYRADQSLHRHAVGGYRREVALEIGHDKNATEHALQNGQSTVRHQPQK